MDTEHTGSSPAAQQAPFVHETAIVESGATLGPDVKIWHFGHVRAGASIGAGTSTGKSVFIDAGVVVGERCKIQNDVFIPHGLTVGDDVFLGPYSVFTNDRHPRAAADWVLTPTSVGSGASISANSTVVAGCDIGSYAIVAAGAVVTKPVAPHQIVAGTPARHHGWACVCGATLSRSQAPPVGQTCPDCERVFPAVQGHRSTTGDSDPETSGDTMTETPTPIAVAKPEVSERSRELLAGAIDRGQLAQGPLVADLERLCAEMAGATHAVGVSSGTDALELAYEAIGLGPGDELITTPFTFGATVNAAIRLGVTVRFADIGDDYTIAPASVAAQITPKTKAVVPVHLFGLPADMAALQAVIADRPDITLVEDAAQAHGAAIGDRLVGTEKVGCFSFYATKNVFAGEGGVITTNDDEIADRCRLLRNQGMAGGGYNYVTVGRNSRMSDLHAAIAIPQLEQLDAITAGRTAMAEAYDKLLVGNSLGLSLPVIPEGRTSAWHQYTVLLPEAVDRAKVADYLKASQIFPGIYYPESLNDVELYRNHKLVESSETPVSRRAATHCLSLPAHHNLAPGDADRVVDVLSAALADPGCRAEA